MVTIFPGSTPESGEWSPIVLLLAYKHYFATERGGLKIFAAEPEALGAKVFLARIPCTLNPFGTLYT